MSNQKSSPILILLLISLLIFSCVFLNGKSVLSYLVEETEINEASGIASSLKYPGILYTHNDSGGEAAVYVLNQIGLMPAKIILKGIENRDWEDIATCYDPKDQKPYVYVVDIGDNNSSHTASFIYFFEEPDIKDTLIVVRNIQKIEFVYEDGPRDAEALMIDPKTGDIYIISKRDETAKIYQLSYPQSFNEVNIARQIGTLPYKWVVAADISPSGDYILVKTYNQIYRYKRRADKNVKEALMTKPKIMTYQLEEQGEAIAFDSKGKGYFTISEKGESSEVKLFNYK